MNKQELIDKLKKLLAMPSEIQGTELDFVHDYVIRRAITLVKQLDEQQAPINEPEKPVVPQFVADWYEERKDYFDFNIYGFYKYFYSQGKHEKVKKWLDNAENKSIETLVKMKLYGYEVEKEKLYTVEIPNPNSAGGKTVLNKDISTGKLILEMLTPDINKPKYLHLTESEIKQDFEWAWQFAKEVEE